MSLHKSIAVFGGFTMVSRITGFIRDSVLANFLGAGLAADAFFVAFKLPNLFRSLFGEGAFNSAFVPIVSGKLAKGKAEAVKFSAEAISLWAFLLAMFVLSMEFAMPWAVAAMAPGFAGDAEKISLAVDLSRLTFPFLLFVSIVSFQSGVLNALGKFAAAAASPVILNLLMTASVFIFAAFSDDPIRGVALGVSVAGFVEILWLEYFLRRENVHLRPRFDIFAICKDKDIKVLFARIAPGIVGSGIYQINVMASTIIASLIGTGAISWLYYASRIQQLPLGIIGAAIGVALLPVLSKHVAAGEEKQAREMQDKAIEIGALLSIPATVLAIILARPMTNILFERGRFAAFDTEMTYTAIVYMAIGIPFFVAVKALSQNLFARGDTKTPVRYSLVSFAVNTIGAAALMGPMGHNGIALASSLSAIASLWLYYRGLKKRGLWELSPVLGREIGKICLASLGMGGVVWAADWLFGGWLACGLAARIGIFGLLGGLGLASFAVAAKLLGVSSWGYFIGLLGKRRGKRHG